MTRSISIGALRQNPTQMLREVKSGASYTITDRGVPIAEIMARRTPRWVPIEEVDALLRQVGSDDDWAAEIRADREGVEVSDPWDHSG